ncbi:hypothetical protein ABZP36_007578 [Zizania latifolia]
MAARKGCTPSQLALPAGVCSHHQGSDVFPISGTTKVDNLDKNVATLFGGDRSTTELKSTHRRSNPRLQLVAAWLASKQTRQERRVPTTRAEWAPAPGWRR